MRVGKSIRFSNFFDTELHRVTITGKLLLEVIKDYRGRLKAKGNMSPGETF